MHSDIYDAMLRICRTRTGLKILIAFVVFFFVWNLYELLSQQASFLAPSGRDVLGNANAETQSPRIDSWARMENEENRIRSHGERHSVRKEEARRDSLAFDPPLQEVVPTKRRKKTKMEWVMGGVEKEQDSSKLTHPSDQDSSKNLPSSNVNSTQTLPSPDEETSNKDSSQRLASNEDSSQRLPIDKESTQMLLSNKDSPQMIPSNEDSSQMPPALIKDSSEVLPTSGDSEGGAIAVANSTSPKLQTLGRFKPVKAVEKWAHLSHNTRLQDKVVTLLTLDSPGMPADVIPRGRTVVLPVSSHNATLQGCDACVVVTSKMAAGMTSYFSGLDLKEKQTSLLAAILAALQLVTSSNAPGVLISHSGINLTSQLESFGLDPVTSGVTYIGDAVFDPVEFFWGPESVAPISRESRQLYRLGNPGRVLVREAFPRYLPCVTRLHDDQETSDPGSDVTSSSSLTSRLLSAVKGRLLPDNPSSGTTGAGAGRSAARLLGVRGRAFDPRAPGVLLARGTFAPLPLHNALLHRDALWTLVARPAVLTSPRPEVWGLWAQRLLWEVNATVMVTQPEVTSEKLDGAAESLETEGRLWAGDPATTDVTVRWLRTWQCEAEKTFVECILTLSSAMKRKGLLTLQEHQLLASWTSALNELGYRFPERRQAPATAAGEWKDRFHPSYVEFVPAIIRRPEACPHSQSLVQRIRSLGQQVKAALVEQGQESAPGPHGDVKNVTGGATEGSTNATQGDLENGLDLLPESHLPNPYLALCGQRGPASYTQEAGLNRDVLLVVILSNKILYPNIPYLDFMYRRHFANVIYCADFASELQANRHFLPRDLSFVEASMELGFFQYNCTAQVLRMNYKVKGHLAVRDDLLLNPWHVASLPRDVPWWQPEVVMANRSAPDVKIRQHREDVWPEWRGEFGTSSLAKVWRDFQNILQGSVSQEQKTFLTSFLDNLSRSTGSDLGVACETSDTFYLPDSLKQEFLFLVEIFDRHKTYLEVAIPTMLTGLVGVENLFRMPGVYLWGKDRALYRETFHPSLVFIHPVKMYKMEKDKEKMEFLCSVYLPLIEMDLNQTATGTV